MKPRTSRSSKAPRGRNRSERGERVEGRIDHLARGGDGVLVDAGNRLTYVAGAFPGDLVQVTRVAGSPQARLERVLEAGPERREAPCDAIFACGGCPWMAWKPELQVARKRARVAETVGVEITWVGGDDELAYRRRARLAFANGRFGYFAPRSDRIVDRPTCAVLAPPLERAWRALRESLVGVLRGKGEIALARRDEGAVATIRASEGQTAEVYAACDALVHSGALLGLALVVEGVAPALFGDPTERTRGADDAPLVGTVGGFSQAHDTLNEVLARAVAELAEPAGARVLELHAGHGNLGVLLARDAAAYVGVELDAEAAEAFRENLRARGSSGRVITGDAATYPRGSYDVVVLDPPRRGAPDVVARLAQEKVPRIVYVSCDLGSLQRDLATLTDAGYVVDHATGLDLFPQTPHVETLVRLVRA